MNLINTNGRYLMTFSFKELLKEFKLEAMTATEDIVCASDAKYSINNEAGQLFAEITMTRNDFVERKVWLYDQPTRQWNKIQQSTSGN